LSNYPRKRLNKNRASVGFFCNQLLNNSTLTLIVGQLIYVIRMTLRTYCTSAAVDAYCGSALSNNAMRATGQQFNQAKI